MKIAAALAIVFVACARPATVVTVKLVDPRRISSPDPADSVYLVEVRSIPLTLLDRVLSGFRAQRTDTIPGIRVDVLPAVVDDSAIVGIWTTGERGRPAGAFRYDPRRRTLSREPLPVWLEDLAPYTEPAFSRDAQHFAYVARRADGDQQALVRHWPDGNVILQGPSGASWSSPPRGRAAWVGDEVMISYDASAASKPVFLIFRGVPSTGRTTRVDTFPWHSSDGVRLLAPQAFKSLTGAVRDSLVVKRCLVPQAEGSAAPPEPHNVISGAFAASGQTDWAALCSRADSSRIVVVWGGPARCPSELGREQNRRLHKGLDSPTYRRLIAAADSVMSGVVYATGPGYRKLDHDAIVERERYYARAWFCENGQWAEVAQSDDDSEVGHEP
jgi:hypothetical protein